MTSYAFFAEDNYSRRERRTCLGVDYRVALSFGERQGTELASFARMTNEPRFVRDA
jgi:hypothetical protein